jgi:hypothetical protein
MPVSQESPAADQQVRDVDVTSGSPSDLWARELAMNALVHAADGLAAEYI